MGQVSRLPARAAVALIAAYQAWLSPLMLPACRFVPTCSAYAREAIERHGIWRGAGLILLRLLRCHPLGKSGLDPVP